MIGDLTKVLDKLAHRLQIENSQPYSTGDIAHWAGVRVGKIAGVALARQAIIDWYTKDTDKERDL